MDDIKAKQKFYEACLDIIIPSLEDWQYEYIKNITNSKLAGYEQGYKEGYEQGYREGLKEGKLTVAKEVAKAFLTEMPNASIEEINRFTGIKPKIIKSVMHEIKLV